MYPTSCWLIGQRKLISCHLSYSNWITVIGVTSSANFDSYFHLRYTPSVGGAKDQTATNQNCSDTYYYVPYWSTKRIMDDSHWGCRCFYLHSYRITSGGDKWDEFSGYSHQVKIRQRTLFVNCEDTTFESIMEITSARRNDSFYFVLYFFANYFVRRE